MTGFATQLLPDAEEARVIRDALAKYMAERPLSEREEDICWKFISKISADLVRFERK